MVATKKGKNWGSKLIWLHKKGEIQALINMAANESGKLGSDQYF
jgi:hypothetical protein